MVSRDYLMNGDTFRAMWCIDSETSREYLLNLKTGECIAERVDGKIVNPEEKGK